MFYGQLDELFYLLNMIFLLKIHSLMKLAWTNSWESFSKLAVSQVTISAMTGIFIPQKLASVTKWGIIYLPIYLLFIIYLPILTVGWHTFISMLSSSLSSATKSHFSIFYHHYPRKYSATLLCVWPCFLNSYLPFS